MKKVKFAVLFMLVLIAALALSACNPSVEMVTVTFDLQGGTMDSPTTVEVVKDSSVKLPIPTKQGYKFEGWFDENRFEVTEQFNFINDTCLVAHWTEKIYTIQFGGLLTEIVNPLFLKFGQEYTLPTPVNAREGYDFGGWLYGDRLLETEGEWLIDDDAYLTASWIPHKYTVIFNIDDSSIEDMVVSYGEQYNLPVPQKDNYKFAGWYTDAKLSEPFLTSGTWDKLHDVSLYPKWGFEASVGLEFEFVNNSYVCVGLGTCTDDNVVIPDYYNGELVIKIGENAFSNASFSSVSIPETICSIGKNAFSNCTNLKKVFITDLCGWFQINLQPGGNPLSNGAILYENGNIVEDLTVIPEGVNVIGSYQFYNSDITSITIPSSVSLIMSYAFWDCENLENVIFEDNTKFKAMSPFAFVSFDNTIKNVYITNLAAWCETYIFWTSFGKSVNLYLNGELVTDLVIPSEVTQICEGAFMDFGSITTVTAEEGSQLQSIGQSAFSNCDSLVKVTLPDSVTIIGRSAFKSCDKLVEVQFSANSQLQIIDGYAFSDCISLTSIDIPSNVVTIEGFAFDGCRNLERVFIPISVKNIAEGAFDYSNNLTIYCEAEKKPDTWDDNWTHVYSVVWGYKGE